MPRDGRDIGAGIDVSIGVDVGVAAGPIAETRTSSTRSDGAGARLGAALTAEPEDIGKYNIHYMTINYKLCL